MNNFLVSLRRYIFLILLEISFLVSKISLVFNIPYLTYLSWLLSLRKIKTNNQGSKKINVLILEKSFGVDDIKQIVEKKLDQNISFYLLNRRHTKIIYEYFQTKDNFLYLKFTNKVIDFFKRKRKINLIISFNINYLAEKIFQKIDKKIGVKFLLCQKESLPSKSMEKIYFEKLKKEKKFTGDLILVYNKIYKELCIESNFADDKIINIVGMPRADDLFYKQNSSKSHITFFMVRGSAGLSGVDKKFTWNDLSEKILNKTLEFSEKNKNQMILFKTKLIKDPETDYFQRVITNKKLKNCKIVKGGNSYELILNSKFLICFHSTSIFEGLIAKKPILIPYFDEYAEQLKEYMCDVSGTKNIFLARNIDEFEGYLNLLSNEEITYSENERDNDKKLIEFNIGNIDGNSTKRLVKSIENLFSNS